MVWPLQPSLRPVNPTGYLVLSSLLGVSDELKVMGERCRREKREKEEEARRRWQGRPHTVAEKIAPIA